MDAMNPSVVIVNSSGTKPISLLNLIIKNSDFEQDEPYKLTQLWKIDTKYYTAHIDVHAITEDYERNDEFNENVKALIVYIDSDSDTCLSNLDKWESFQNDCELDAKLLVIDNPIEETVIPSSQITEICYKYGYEFIVLNPKLSNDVNIEDEVEEVEIIKERFGVDRIIEVLQTCVWPNLMMKELGNPIPSQHLQDNDELNGLADDGLDEFSELFGQIYSMKENIQSMSMDQRKLYAEQMVTAFWRAIGGDEDELEDV